MGDICVCVCGELYTWWSLRGRLHVLSLLYDAFCKGGRKSWLVVLFWFLVLTIFNERVYLRFKSIFHKALNLFHGSNMFMTSPKILEHRRCPVISNDGNMDMTRPKTLGRTYNGCMISTCVVWHHNWVTNIYWSCFCSLLFWIHQHV